MFRAVRKCSAQQSNSSNGRSCCSSQGHSHNAEFCLPTADNRFQNIWKRALAFTRSIILLLKINKKTVFDKYHRKKWQMSKQTETKGKDKVEVGPRFVDHCSYKGRGKGLGLRADARELSRRRWVTQFWGGLLSKLNIFLQGGLNIATKTW